MNVYAAWGLALLGFFGFLFQGLKSFINAIREPWPAIRRLAAWPALEKALACILLALLLLFATAAVIPAYYSDSWINHLPLANSYINAGRLVFNPYHFHSYLPQNTEMLATWALLLHSEVAATLVSWGFLAGYVCLLIGQWIRVADPFCALAVAVAVLSSYTIAWTSGLIKNDLPLYVFTYANYYALIEAFGDESNDTNRPWFLLSGIFSGGAIGHKLSGISVVASSFLVILIADVIRAKRFRRSHPIFLFITGVLLAYSPWCLRAWIGSGNPIFPFFDGVFRLKATPFDLVIQSTFFDAGAAGVPNYFNSLLTGGGRPWFSPVLLFALLSPFVFVKKVGLNYKISMLGAALGMGLLMVSTQVRFTIGYLAFIVATCLGLVLGEMTRQGLGVFRKSLISLGLLFCLFQTYWNTEQWIVLRSSVHMILAGYSPGNFRAYISGDDESSAMRWINYLLNTRTPRKELVLYAGTSYVYGLNRKAFFGYWCRDLLMKIAQDSSNTAEMRRTLESLGVEHIIVRSDFFKQLGEFPMNRWPASPADIERLKDFFLREARFRYAAPFYPVRWYALSRQQPDSSISFGAKDALQFPVKFIEEAATQLLKGNKEQAQLLLEIAVKTPMRVMNKISAHEYLAKIYKSQGKPQKTEEGLTALIREFPDQADGVAALASFYQDENQDAKAMEQYRNAIGMDPSYAPAYLQMGNLCYRTGNVGEALRFYSELVELDPRSFAGHKNLGMLYLRMGDRVLAQRFIQKCFLLNPHFGITFDRSAKRSTRPRAS